MGTYCCWSKYVPLIVQDESYLVCYVKRVDDTVQALERLQCGGWVLVPPQAHGQIQVAVIVDPNGYCIRLIEVKDYMLKVPFVLPTCT